MEQLFAAFGIDVRLIVIQMVNFGLLLVVMWYFLYTPVLKLLRERQEKIEQGIKDAEAAAAARTNAETEKQSMLSAAEVEAAAIQARATEQAKKKGNEIVKTAEQRAEDVLQDARLKGVELQNQVRRESEQEIAKLAVLAAEKILRNKSQA